MKFTEYWKSLDSNKKRDLAKALETSVVYLSQIANGHRNAGAKILMGIEMATGGEITPTDIRQAA